MWHAPLPCPDQTPDHQKSPAHGHRLQTCLHRRTRNPRCRRRRSRFDPRARLVCRLRRQASRHRHARSPPHPQRFQRAQSGQRRGRVAARSWHQHRPARRPRLHRYARRPRSLMRGVWQHQNSLRRRAACRRQVRSANHHQGAHTPLRITIRRPG